MLRPYQTAALEAILSNPTLSGIVVAPTGSGKTHIMKALYDAVGRGGGVVFIIWEKSVKAQLAALLGRDDIIFSPSSGALPSLSAHTIVIDEVHHFRRGKAWGRFLDSGARVVGFTATPVWVEDLSLPILYRIPYYELRQEGWIAPPLSGVLASTDEEEAQALDSLGPNRRVVTYISRKEEWRGEEKDGRLITAETPVEERLFFPWETQICNIATLTTGWDNRDINAILLRRRIGEAQTFLQIIGRLRRGGVIIDRSDNILRFGLDEDVLSATLGHKGAGGEGKGIPALKRCLGCERLISPRLQECPYCGWHAPEPHISGKLWEPMDVDKWIKEFGEIGWRRYTPCPYTPKGSWPVKLPNRETAYVGLHTYEHWNGVLNRLKDVRDKVAEGEGLAFFIPRSWWILLSKPDGSLMYACSLEYGSSMTWQRI